MKRTYWETIDYVGGGFVLQRKMRAEVTEKTRRHGEHARFEVQKREPYINIEKTTRQRKKFPSRDKKMTVANLDGLNEQLRIAHVLDLDVDTTEFVKNAEDVFDVEDD